MLCSSVMYTAIVESSSLSADSNGIGIVGYWSGVSSRKDSIASDGNTTGQYSGSTGTSRVDFSIFGTVGAFFRSLLYNTPATGTLSRVCAAHAYIVDCISKSRLRFSSSIERAVLVSHIQ